MSKSNTDTRDTTPCVPDRLFEVSTTIDAAADIKCIDFFCVMSLPQSMNKIEHPLARFATPRGAARSPFRVSVDLLREMQYVRPTRHSDWIHTKKWRKNEKTFENV